MESVTLRPLDARVLALFRNLLVRDEANGPHRISGGTLFDRRGGLVMTEQGEHRPELLAAMADAVDEHNSVYEQTGPSPWNL